MPGDRYSSKTLWRPLFYTIAFKSIQELWTFLGRARKKKKISILFTLYVQEDFGESACDLPGKSTFRKLSVKFMWNYLAGKHCDFACANDGRLS